MISRYPLTILLLLFMSATAMMGQRLYLTSFDLSAYPTIRAKLFASGADGKRIVGISPSDITITENGHARPVTSIVCPPGRPAAPVSLAMSIDVSGSMREGLSDRPVELGKTTARELANLMKLPPSEMALQICNDRALLAHDFTSNRDNILRAIDPVDAGGGNDFIEHLLNDRTGILNIAKLGKHRRAAVLYTDAWWYPLGNAELQRCKDTCAKYDIRFYAVIYSRPEAEPNGIKSSLRLLAEATGGQMFDGVTTRAAARAIASDLETLVEGDDPCEITWVSRKQCAQSDVEVTISLASPAITERMRYTPPDSALVRLDLAPASLTFGPVAPGTSRDLTTTITAHNASIAVGSILPSDPNFTIVDYGGSPPPFTLNDGESRTLTVRFTPPDSLLRPFKLEIATDYCPRVAHGWGGFPGKGVANNTLRLTRPNGGEELPVRSDTVITWEGVAPSDTVRLEYSIDAGASWQLIAPAASGLSYPWKVPNTPSRRCLARATLLTSPGESPVLSVPRAYMAKWSPDGLFLAAIVSDNSAEKFVEILDSRSGILLTKLPADSGMVYHIAWSPDGTKIATVNADPGLGADYTVHIWDAGSGAILKTLPGHSAVVKYIVWSPDGSKIATCSHDRTAHVLDVTTGAVLGVFPFEPSVANNVEPLAWSPDGGRLAIVSPNETVRIADAATGATLFDLQAGMGTIWNVQWNPLYDQLAVAMDNGTVIWNAGDGSKSATFPSSQSGIRFIAWTHDGRRFVTYSVVELGRVWDVATGALLTSFGDASSVRISISHDDTRILMIGQRNGRIGVASIWDLATGKLLRDLVDDSTGAWMYLVGEGEWSADDRQVLTVSNDFIARTWNVGGVELLGDLSDSLWAIVVPQIRSLDVDMGEVLVGSGRDSLVRAFLRNDGGFPIGVEKIDIVGGDAGDFKVVSGIPPRTIPGRDSGAVEFSFHPSAPGPRESRVRIVFNGDTLYQRIFGVGLAPSLQVVSTLVDFGAIGLMTSKDSLVAATIRNIGTAPIDITATRMLGPDTAQFEIVSGGGAFTLLPGESRPMMLRYSARRNGGTSGMVGFEYDGAGSPAVMELFGRGIGGMVYVADDSAAAGEPTTLALMIDDGGLRTTTVESRPFTATLRFNQTLLAPEDRAAPGITAGGERTITVDGVWSGVGDTLATIPMVALLGDAEQTSLDIISFEWLDDARRPLGVESDRKSGTFRLLGLCREGSTRLYDEHGVEAALKVAPNPSADAFELEYDLAEDGAIAIDLYDLSGVKLRSVLDADRPAGSYRMRLSTSRLPAGAYLLILRTPTRILSRKVEVRR